MTNYGHNWTTANEYPHSPANVQVMSGFEVGIVDIRWDDPSILETAPPAYGGKTNAGWEIVGCNIYRSDDGDRGPYRRLNQYPVSALFWRDFTENIWIEQEKVDLSDWVSRGYGELGAWQFRIKIPPIVKKTGQKIFANSPDDVVLRINGQIVPIHTVDGASGLVTLINQKTYDIAREKYIDPILPSETDTVEISYWRNVNVVRSSLDHKHQVWYRITTVAKSDDTPSGLVETPLNFCEPISMVQKEPLDYIWKEALRRNNWILEQGGERVKLFVRKRSGITCHCTYDETMVGVSKQPSNRCERCFGTGFVGGYEGPYEIIVCPDDGEVNIVQTERGRNKEHTYECWIGPTPSVSQKDFIVKQDGDRYSIGAVRRPSNRGNLLNQFFSIGYLDEADIRYRVPVLGISENTFPETRYTDEWDYEEHDDRDTYPVGADNQSQPQTTEKENIPDEREKRGRTPVWENQNY